MLEIQFIGNSGEYLESKELPCIPVAGQYIKLGHDFYEIWRVMYAPEGIKAQLGTRLNPSPSKQNELFFK